MIPSKKAELRHIVISGGGVRFAAIQISNVSFMVWRLRISLRKFQGMQFFYFSIIWRFPKCNRLGGLDVAADFLQQTGWGGGVSDMKNGENSGQGDISRYCTGCPVQCFGIDVFWSNRQFQLLCKSQIPNPIPITFQILLNYSLKVISANELKFFGKVLT